MSFAQRRHTSRDEIADPGLHPLDRLLAERRPIVMGVLNLTPDSFSDGGRFEDPGSALAHAQRMIAEGADIIDVGGESSRPYVGARRVSADGELARVMPVLPRIVALGVPVSIDTMKAAVAARALGAGAVIVNDVWGLQRDPDMAGVVAAHRVPVVVTHNRDAVDPAIDILADIEAFFSRSLAIAERAGIARNRIVLDPGIGFGKTPEQSLAAIAGIGRLRAFGLPVLVGLSRKRFINAIVPSAPQDRLAGSIAGNVLAVLEGAAIVRVHDVAETVQALRVAAAIRAAR
ncbi:MAG TPA: dihydropteroate synthase [Xanthobacteraceae bacterium]|nr:dihydropteroate synthase [Xanthobacteraceae bacterium]